jgi:GntR family transcriptional regulator, sialic acid-inducible nan operon repressor
LIRKPIKRRKIPEEVADRIEAMIHESGLKTGHALPSERDIMAAYQVDRSAVREAYGTGGRRRLAVRLSSRRGAIRSDDALKAPVSRAK